MSIESSTLGGRTKIKLVLLGDQGVGKSAIIDKYVNDKFTEIGISTIGIDFMVKNVLHKNRSFRLQLWDTAGQERFKSLIPSYLKDAICCVVVFDVTRRESLANAVSWLNLYKNSKQEPRRAILVGNKVDLNMRSVTRSEGEEMAKNLQIPYIEVSAKTGKRLEDLFNLVIELSVFQNSTQIMKAVEEIDQKRIVEQSTSGASNKEDSQKQGSQKQEGSFKQGTNIKDVKIQEKSFALNKPVENEIEKKSTKCKC